MNNWNTIYKQLPNDTQTVWIRVLNIYGQITLATYDELTQTFTTIPTNLIIPVYLVARWKTQ